MSVLDKKTGLPGDTETSVTDDDSDIQLVKEYDQAVKIILNKIIMQAGKKYKDVLPKAGYKGKSEWSKLLNANSDKDNRNLAFSRAAIIMKETNNYELLEWLMTASGYNNNIISSPTLPVNQPQNSQEQKIALVASAIKQLVSVLGMQAGNPFQQAILKEILEQLEKI